MAAKTLATYISELSAGSSLGAGDRIPTLEAGALVYFGGDAISGGITALTGDVTASGTGSVPATIANGAVTNAKVASGIDAVKIGDGSISNTEFQYLNGVSSNIQTQLDGKVDENGAIVAATKTKITYDTKGLVTAGADATTADIADSSNRRYVTDAQLVVIGNTSGTNTGDQTNISGNAGTVTVADAGGDTTTWVLLGTSQTGSLSPATDAGLTYNATTNALTATTFIGALTGNADTVTGFSGTSSGTNTGDQTITNSSDATSHTVTLSASGGSVQLVEGSGITLTTTGTGSAGIVTIAATGDIANGGNTTGAAVTIGTNDAFGLNLETAGVTRVAITGAASTGGAVTITNVTANTNTVQDVLTIQCNSTGTAANSFGAGVLFQGETSTTDNQDWARLSAIQTNATHASLSSAFTFQARTSGGALAEVARLTGAGSLVFNAGSGTSYGNTGIVTATGYTIGNSSSALTLGAGSGTIDFSRNTATTNTTVPFTFSANSTGTPANGLGPQLQLRGESSTTTNQLMGSIQSVWTDVTDASRSAALTFSTVNNAASITERMRINADGKVGVGLTPTTDIFEVAGNLSLTTAGNKIKIATGSNASAGVSGAMTGGTITISTTAVTASSLIYLTHASVGGTVGVLSVGTVTAGTSFVINSSSGSDTSTVNWWIVN